MTVVPTTNEKKKQRQRKQKSSAALAPPSIPTPASSVLIKEKNATELALQQLQAEAQAASIPSTITSISPRKHTSSRQIAIPPAPPQHRTVPLSPRAAKVANHSVAQFTSKNSKTSVPASMIPTLRAKVSRASMTIQDVLETSGAAQQKSRRDLFPTSGAAQAAEVLNEVAQSVQGALVIRDESSMIESLSNVVDVFIKSSSTKNEIVTPTLMCLASLFRRFAQLTETGHQQRSGGMSKSSVGTTTVDTESTAATWSPIYSLGGCKELLQLSIRCVIHLHDVISKQMSNEALESGVPRLAASAHLLKGLAEYCTFTSDPPTPRELETRDLFVAGGGATALLALSQSNLKTSSRPARVALANFDMKDLAMLASPTFELNTNCQFVTDPLATSLTTMATAALEVEMTKRSKRQNRAKAVMRKHKAIRDKEKRTLEERQEKLEQWLGKRGEQEAVSREKWKEKDQQQKALLAAKLESDKARYMEERKERAETADQYRRKMLDRFQEQKQVARAREAAKADAERAAGERKREANEAKVEDWLKKKRDTMRDERDRQLASHRVSHRKNMHNLRRINNKTFGNSDWSEPIDGVNKLSMTAATKKPRSATLTNTASSSIVPGSGYQAPSIGGAKLVHRSSRQQTVYGKGGQGRTPAPPTNPRVRPTKDQFYAPPASTPSFGITGTSLRS
jgi:hypothetical protein